MKGLRDKVIDRQVRLTLPESGGLVMVKENILEVEIVHGCFMGISDSIQVCALGNLAVAL